MYVYKDNVCPRIIYRDYCELFIYHFNSLKYIYCFYPDSSPDTAPILSFNIISQHHREAEAFLQKKFTNSCESARRIILQSNRLVEAFRALYTYGIIKSTHGHYSNLLTGRRFCSFFFPRARRARASIPNFIAAFIRPRPRPIFFLFRRSLHSSSACNIALVFAKRTTASVR